MKITQEPIFVLKNGVVNNQSGHGIFGSYDNTPTVYAFNSIAYDRHIFARRFQTPFATDKVHKKRLRV